MTERTLISEIVGSPLQLRRPTDAEANISTNHWPSTSFVLVDADDKVVAWIGEDEMFDKHANRFEIDL